MYPAEKPKSVFKYAADGGLYVGAILSLMSLCMVASIRIANLSLLVLPLAILLPIAVGYLMIRMVKETPSYKAFSALWLHGIYSFLFGSLIAAGVTTLYLQFVEPDFVRLCVLQAIEAAKNVELTPELSSMITQMQESLEAHRIPSRMQFVFSMMWSTCFFGAVGSLLIAAVVKSLLQRPNFAVKS